MPCHISTKAWTFAIVCKFHSSASLFSSKSFSVFVIVNAGSSPSHISVLALANCLTTTSSQRVLPVVFACLQPIRTFLRGRVASTPTPCGMTENMSCATLERSGYFECVSSCFRHQSVTSGIQNVLLISIRSQL